MSEIPNTTQCTALMVIKPRRPEVIPFRGGWVDIQKHDIWYKNRMRWFKRRIAAQHPDLCGKRYIEWKFLRLMGHYRQFKRDQEKWYRWHGLQPPRSMKKD